MYCTIVNADGTFMDIEGNVVKRTKSEYPYSYDPIVVFRNFQLESDNTVWSDRLFQWDYEKYNKLCTKHFGNESQYWYDRNPELVESFLSDYVGYEIKLVRITESCNVSSGFPVWSFDFKRV